MELGSEAWVWMARQSGAVPQLVIEAMAFPLLCLIRTAPVAGYRF